MKWILALIGLLISGWAQADALLIARLAVGADPGIVAARYQISLVDLTEGAPFVLYNVPAPLSIEAIIAMMATDPDIVWSEDDRQAEMPENSSGGKGSTIAVVGDLNALYGQNSAWLSQIHFDWPRNRFSKYRARVAILDTGVSPYQPILWGRVCASINLVEPGHPTYDLPYLFDTGDSSAEPGVGHGTMVAGLVAQMSPLSDLVIAKVADRFGHTTSWKLIKGLAFAVTNGAQVANLSLGSVGPIQALRDVCDWVEAHNVVLVASIGNNSADMALAPADYSKVICVAGVDPTDHKASFSNWNSSADVCAPSTGIKSFWWDGTLGIWSGTSFAAPIISGSIAAGLTLRGFPADVATIRSAVHNSGANIDLLNPAYSGKLGRRIDYHALRLAIRNL